MSLKPFFLLSLIALLSACAHQRVEVVQGSADTSSAGDMTSTSYVGLGVESIPPKAVGAYMTDTLNALNKALAESEAPQWQSNILNDGSVRLQTVTATGFDTDSAELRPAALDALGRIAKVIKTFRKTTVHVLANGRNVNAAAFSQSLSDRRAAALTAYLNQQGVGGIRTRYEGSANAQSGTLQILIRPVVSGNEAQAWMSPP